MERLKQNIQRLFPKKPYYEADSDMLLRRLGFVEKRRFRKDRVINNPDDPLFVEQTHQVFSPGRFVYEDVYEAIKSTAPLLADALSGLPSEKTKVLLIDFGVKVTPIIEAAAPLAMKRDQNDIAGRIGHTIARAQSTLQETNNEPMTSRVQRDNIIFAFSDALTYITTPVSNKMPDLIPFPAQNDLQLLAAD